MNRLGNKIVSSVLACAVAVSLAACGGRGSQSALPSTPGASGTTVPSSELVNATFTITIPAPAATSAKARRPAYISAATKSVQVHMTTSTRIASPGAQFNVVTNVPNASGNSPGAPCTGTGPYTCTLAIQVPPGSDTFTFTTWDAAGGTGNILSQQQQTLTVVAGVANSFNVTFDANANTMVVSGSGSCESGPVGSAFGSVGTTPVTYTVAYTDPATKAIASPGLPKLEIQDNTSTFQATSGTVNGTGGTVAFAINQAAQTFTLTPSNSTVTNATINVKAVPANSTGSSDGLSFSLTKSFTFSSGTAPPSHNFLAAVEQIGVGSGKVDLFNVALGGSGATDTISAFTPATLAVTTSTNDPTTTDVDNPLDLVWDSSGDLLIGNGGTTTGGDNGNLACVPAGAISTGANSATTVSTNVDDPVGIAYDSRDGSVALANNPSSAPYLLAEFLLSGNYVAAPTTRDIAASNGYGSFSVVNIPTLAAGTYAIGLTDGIETDPAHNTGKSKIAIESPTGVETDITDTTTFAIDVPRGLAWDAQNSQLVIANNSAFHKLLAFYTVSPAAQVKTINTGRRNYMVAASADGHVAVAGTNAFGNSQVQVYDGTAARNAVSGPIPFNGTTTSCGSTYIYASEAVNSMIWLSNTKLLIALQSFNGSTATAQNGLYVFDISATATPAGFDDVTCSAFSAAPKQTGFTQLSLKPLGTAFKP